MDSLDRAKAYGDYLPIEEGPQDQYHALCQQPQAFFEVTLSVSLQHSFTLFPFLGFLIQSVHLSFHISLPSCCSTLFFSLSLSLDTHNTYLLSLLLSLSFSIFLHRPHSPSGNYGKSVIVLRGADNTFSLIKDIYGM